MANLFISDLHLDATAGVEMLGETLASFRNDTISDLYILGDLFDSWIGDDDDQAIARAVAELLALYDRAGWRIHFLPGNRDFLLGSAYLSRFHGQLLSDPSLIDLYGHRVLLIHGDRECLADTEYQQVRKQLRDPAWQSEFLNQPLPQRRQFAAQARARSQAHTQAQSATIMDADVDELVRLADAHRCQAIIHGHTHRPAIHVLAAADGAALRLVLGAWHRGPSWLRVDQSGCQLLAEGNTIEATWPAQ